MFKPAKAGSLLISLGLLLSSAAPALATAWTVPATRTASQSVSASEYYDLHLAYSQLRENRDAEALMHLFRALEKNPHNILAQFHLGNSYLELAKQTHEPSKMKVYLEQSAQAFEQVSILNPELAITYFKLGKIALMQGDTNKAKAIYSQGLEQDPKNPGLMFNLARVYDQTEEADKAIEYYKKTLVLQPDFIYAYNNLGLLYETRQQFALAEKAYKKSLAVDKSYNLPRLNLGNLYASTERHSEAGKMFKEALKHEPENPWVHYYIGNYHMRVNQFEQAAQSYEKASRLNPGHPTTYYLLAVSLSKLKRMDEALQASLHYIQLAPQGEFSSEMKTLILSVKLLQGSGLYFSQKQPEMK